MGYLNNTGLSHFWNKLKQFFVKKSEVENAGISSISYTTVLASTTVTTALATGYRYPSAVLKSSVPTGFSQAYLYRITIGNTEKRMPCVLWYRKNNAGTGIQPIEFIGNPSYMLAEDVTSYFGHGAVDTTCGFCISARDIANDGARKLMLFTPTAGSYTVKIELENRDVTKFPPDLTFDYYNNPISEVANANQSNSVSVGPNYMKHKTGTTSVGSGNTNSGANSTSVGVFNEASGQLSVAVGTQNKASGLYSLAVGNSNQSTGSASSALGYFTESSGAFSTTNGNRTIANHKSQFVFGELNKPDPSEAAATARGTYVEIVGNGTGTDLADRSNARTLDWLGNERLAGGLTLGAGGANETTITPEQLADTIEMLRRAITTKRGTPAASTIDLNTFCDYGEYDISLSTVSNAPPNVRGIKLIVQSTVADTETTGGHHPKDTIQIFIGDDTSGVVKIFTRLYLRTSSNIKYWSPWSSSGPAPILELSDCSWRGNEVQASISNMTVYDVDGMDILAIKVPCDENGDYADDAFICFKAYDSIMNQDMLTFTSVPNSDGQYLQLTLESNISGTIVSGEILNIHDVLVYNITFDSQGEANQPISFNSALALLLSGTMIILKAGGIYYYPAYGVTSNTNSITFATVLDESGYWNCCIWQSSTGKISTEEYDFMGMVYDGYGGQFIPSGGTTGQFLVKNSNANYDVGWATVPNANGVSF